MAAFYFSVGGMETLEALDIDRVEEVVGVGI